MNIFIDTNIYLIFYHFTSEDLEELKKLLVAIEKGEVNLYIPEQVISEYGRNRERKISDALKKLNNQRLSIQFPQICKQYNEFEDLMKLVELFEKRKKEMFEKLHEDIDTKNLRADKIISKLFNNAKVIKTNNEILMRARNRIDLGNPPGKTGSYCDAINWESLLDSVPDNEDLYLVTDDKDYISQIYENNLSQFLLEEWNKKKNSNIYLYRRLSDFFREKYPDIKLASDFEKELAISALISSSKFSDTHLAIAKLSKFTDFSDLQINKIIETSVTNNQIYWIKDDEDIRSFFNNLVEGKEDIIDSNILKKFSEMYRTESEDELSIEEEVPF